MKTYLKVVNSQFDSSSFRGAERGRNFPKLSQSSSCVLLWKLSFKLSILSVIHAPEYYYNLKL
jgi:hypothetical protein